DIEIDGDIIVNEKLAILAEGNITTTVNATEITARTNSNNGADIHIVAGAGLTSSSNGVFSAQANANVTVDPAVLVGGNIDFSASPSLQIHSNGLSGNKDGANVS